VKEVCIMQGDYLTIKEFAEKVGLSVQAIYPRLNGDFKPYLKCFKGKKHLNIEALSLFDSNNFKDFKANLKEALNPLESLERPLESDAEKVSSEAIIENFKDALNVFKEQLLEKDEQLAVKDEQIANLHERLREALILNQNNQMLLGMEKENRTGFLQNILSKIFNRKRE
jgi:transcriptional regulator with XRE-family HTH domain